MRPGAGFASCPNRNSRSTSLAGSGRLNRKPCISVHPSDAILAFVAEKDVSLLIVDDNPKRRMIDRLFEPLTQVSWLGMDGTRS